MIITILLKLGIIKIKAYQFKVYKIGNAHKPKWSEWQVIEKQKFDEILVYIEMGYKYQTRCLYDLNL